jgi:hypothetical protein
VVRVQRSMYTGVLVPFPLCAIDTMASPSPFPFVTFF